MSWRHTSYGPFLVGGFILQCVRLMSAGRPRLGTLGTFSLAFTPSGRLCKDGSVIVLTSGVWRRPLWWDGILDVQRVFKWGQRDL